MTILYIKKTIFVKLQYLIVIMVISCLIRMVITLFLGFYVASFSSIVSLSLPLLTYASRSADCADVASCHSQSVSLCSTSPKGFTLSRTHARAHTHTSAYNCHGGQLPSMASRSRSSLVNSTASSSRCLTLRSSTRLPVGNFVTKAVAEKIPAQILLCNTDLMHVESWKQGIKPH